MTQAFTSEQTQYLQGFVSGHDVASTLRGLPTFSKTVDVLGLPPGANPGPAANGVSSSGATTEVATGPDAIGIAAQNVVLAEGKKLTPEERAKRAHHPLDAWGDMSTHARNDQFPKGTDVLAWKYHGLFYVAPTQDSYMSRLRFAGGLMRSSQMRDLAAISETYGGGYADVTTRANLQVREIKACDATDYLMSLQDAGIVARGSGADNIRNITGTPTAGIDTQEIYDTRALCREMHHAILNRREMYGLPRKFNIAFDGGGTISALEDTNDIGFAAVRVGEGQSVPPGVYFRMQLGGITGHQDFARDVGVLLDPEQCVPIAIAVVRAFIEHGDRTDRKKARLKYVLDRLGMEKYLAETQRHLDWEPKRFPLEDCQPRGPVGKHAHVGVHPQKQDGLFYIGVVVPVGRIRADQMRGLAELADRHGSGTLRLTVWQNLLLSDIRESELDTVKQQIEVLGLDWNASGVRAGLIACTGNAGCKYAAANTKKHALQIADHLEALERGGAIALDAPVNIHVTGCPNSCAQHYIGDLGFLGTNVEAGDDFVEGYHVYLGGGYGTEQGIGREVFRSVRAEDAPQLVETLLAAHQESRHPNESFLDWTKRHSTEQLQAMSDINASV